MAHATVSISGTECISGLWIGSTRVVILSLSYPARMNSGFGALFP